jgi:gamma-glutamyltranspeptidase/glutathione hydrolase
MRRSIWLGILLYTASTMAQSGPGDRVSGVSWASRSPVLGRHGMAATSHPLASQIALDILKQGGTAVDAAIAANAALGLMEPTGSGIGGDLYAIVWDPKTKRLHGLNASGRSPHGMTLAQLQAAVRAIPTTAPTSRPARSDAELLIPMIGPRARAGD